MRRWSNPLDFFSRPNPVYRRANPAGEYRVVGVDPSTQAELFFFYVIAHSPEEAREKVIVDFGSRGLLFAGFKSFQPYPNRPGGTLYLYFRPFPVAVAAPVQRRPRRLEMLASQVPPPAVSLEVAPTHPAPCQKASAGATRRLKKGAFVAPAPSPIPALHTYDAIIVSSSAGKDSQAALDYVMELAVRAGVVSRVVVVHSDLGRVEWEGTAELAQKQAEHYGVSFLKVQRPGEDLLQHVERRGMWPSHRARFCTSEHKTSQIRKVFTAITKQLRQRLNRRVRILDVQGIRAQESGPRSAREPFCYSEDASNTLREVHRWYPIFHWTHEQVWDRIRASGAPYHYAYDIGMPRLSCCFCIYAGRDVLLVAGKHNRALLNEYARVEQATGHRFKQDLSITEIRDAVERGEEPEGELGSWDMD